MNDYELLDSGDGKKLEKFGPYILQRPAAAAIWKPQKPALWQEKHASFTRDPSNKWTFHKDLPASWTISINGISYLLQITDFGHLGIFPEHQNQLQSDIPKGMRILNLFAYTGAASLHYAKRGAQVCHVDASKKSIAWFKENLQLNGLENAKVRWILDDAVKFLKKEIRRESFYDAVILDPPTFGRGPKKEPFLLEDQINELLQLCSEVLVQKPQFVLFTCHTPGFTPLVLKQLMEVYFDGNVSAGEMVIPSKESFALPAGSYAKWNP